MNKIAVISDIHGNLEALKAVIKDIKNESCDMVICLGDIIAKGYHLHECIDLVKEISDVVIQGNCDYFFSNFTKADNSKNDARLQYNISRTTLEDREYLKSLPYSYDLLISGNIVRFYHATPTKIDGFVGDMENLDTYYNMFLPSTKTSSDIADVVLYGHIHKAFVKKLYNRTLINVGSVGNNFEVYRDCKRNASNAKTTKACYVILKGELNSKEEGPLSYEFREIPYDVDKELESSKEAFEYDGLVSELKYGKYRDYLEIKKNLSDHGIIVE